MTLDRLESRQRGCNSIIKLLAARIVNEWVAEQQGMTCPLGEAAAVPQSDQERRAVADGQSMDAMGK